MVIQHVLQKYVMKWYHKYLLHPGIDKMVVMIYKHLYLLVITKAVQMEVTNCDGNSMLDGRTDPGNG